ncbi:RES family NAD+ phosphorylase [Anaeromyxobacter sp. Red801]|uniref:RES family NAD+ phosphorylase n=1 Tax=Anaeromyxobacter sp. Red801 TaxID=3411632 RepID=UPI003BA09BF0
MDAWRITFARHAPDGRRAFSGEGARLYGGRWNSKGVAVSYASATLSLAALELLTHADQRLLAGAPLAACRATWPDDLAVETAPPSVYVRGWRHSPAPAALATFGDRWIAERRTAILLVRSAVIPSERNVLLNPAHRDAARVAYGAPEPFSFDPRLVR